MITYAEAVRIIDENTQRLGSQVLSTAGSGDSFLAADVVAQIASPPFDNSAVDGFGRRAEDLDAESLKLAGAICAGDSGDLEVPRGAAVRIFTGAPVPRSIATVSMQEDCELQGERVAFALKSDVGDHIRRAGSDFSAGTTLIQAGRQMSPPLIGLALSGGCDKVDAIAKPSVSIGTTGDELIKPGDKLRPGGIYNSNEGALFQAARGLGIQPRVWHAKDDPAAIRSSIESSLEQSDVLITCGGVSVGEHDYLKQVFRELGVTERFWSVAIKPGKPVFFGTAGEKLVFGLPGNPVSALVTFQLFVRPALLKMMGQPNPWPTPAKLRFEGGVRKKPGRMDFLRGIMSSNGVREAGAQGSHQLMALAEADCLIHFPLELSELRDGDLVDVTPLKWGIT
jgi:molybdopterin molybdotransferase